MKRKVLTGIVTLMFVFGLIGCGKKDVQNQDVQSQGVQNNSAFQMPVMDENGNYTTEINTFDYGGPMPGDIVYVDGVGEVPYDPYSPLFMYDGWSYQFRISEVEETEETETEEEIELPFLDQDVIEIDGSEKWRESMNIIIKEENIDKYIGKKISIGLGWLETTFNSKEGHRGKTLVCDSMAGYFILQDLFYSDDLYLSLSETISVTGTIIDGEDMNGYPCIYLQDAEFEMVKIKKK